MKKTNYTIKPDFIAGSKGRLYSLYYEPLTINKDSECFIVAAPFAEEMNRCRYMCTLLAQNIAQSGYGFLSVDSYGTGDSEGDFSELSWKQTCLDLLSAVDYAQQQGYKKISILAIRLGVLQALDIAGSIKNLHRMIFWQPVLNGNLALTQFLRIKIASSINRDENAGTIKSFEEQISQGNNIEVAGYELSPEMFNSIKKARFLDHIKKVKAKVGWFTTIPSQDRKPPRQETIAIEKWKEEGTIIDYSIIIDPPYWQVHERTLAPNLIDATVNYIKGAN